MLVVELLFAWMLVIAFLAFIACTFEDLESDVGSQSNPNSQVQLAAQVGQVHRFFNKAISGEPLSNAMYCTVAGTTAWILLQKLEPIVPDAKWKAAVVAIPLGVAVAAMIHIIFSITAHCGRTAGQKRFEQPIYLDVLYGHLLPIATHGFMTTFCITSIAYIQSNLGTLAGDPRLNHPFALPLLAFIWGITVGAIGSSTGDIHYGTEREFQDRPFGEGKRVVYHGKITRYAECGVRTQKDIVGFCAKFGGPCTGLTFGLIILFENYRTLIGMELARFLPVLPADLPFVPDVHFATAAGNMSAVWGIVVGLFIIAALLVGNMVFVRWVRKKYGPFVGA
ncbi:MAG: tetrahydromethanopterin S-methyltransferase subunit E [Methanophagales archaeon]|nr:tetrahydromethanopterin S-methyltransferase subunit E [Methanophagales archaeon]